MRKCRLCGEYKHIDQYHKTKKGVNGRDSRCKECKNAAKRKLSGTKSQLEKDRKYRSTEDYRRKRELRKIENGYYSKLIQRKIDENKAKERAGRKYVSHDEAVNYGLPRYFDGTICKRGHMSERSTSNRQCLECCAEKRNTPQHKRMKAKYYMQNRDRLTSVNTKRQRERYNEDPQYKLAVAARNMLKRVLRKGNKPKHGGSYEILGYSHNELMNHLESQFTEGMSWDNYGDWHIDHIIPVSWFIKMGETSPSVINDLSNLRPMWAEDNLKKSASID
jgi:hypothetical protein